MVPGFADDHNAYRAELTGILAMLCALQCLCAEHGIEQGQITLACDGLGAIRKALDEDSTFSCNSAQFDLLEAIDEKARALPIQILWRHVDGHQDDKGFGPLDRWATLNVEMDERAKRRLARSAPSHSTFQIRGGKAWRLHLDAHYRGSSTWRTLVGGKQIGNALQERVTDFCLGGKTLKFWLNRSWMGSQVTESDIDWKALGKARESTTQGLRIWGTKFASGCCGVATTLHRRRQRSQPTCERCSRDDEDAAHVLRCPAGDDRFEELAAVLTDWGSKSKAAPNLMKAILHGLASWRNGEEVAATCPTSLKGDLRSAYEAQSAIGWGALWFGFASSHWQIVQQHYFRAAGSRRTGERWVAALIKKLQDAAWDMWSFRNFQIHSGHDEEAETEVTILNQRIRVHYQLGTLGLLPEAKPLLNTPLGRVLQRPLRARIAWLETVAMSREAYMQVRLPHKLRCYFRLRFLKGGLLARLKRNDKPPTLRLSSAAPRTRLEHLDPQLDP